MDADSPPQPPPDSTASTAKHGSRLRHRTSLPAPVRTADVRQPRKAASSHVRTQAASPEVISSLIDQLSAIAVPAHNHFENLPVGYGHSESLPASPGFQPQSRATSVARHDGSSALDAGAYYESLRDQNARYPDDACEPPVVRTSKPPSGKSPLTAPKKPERPHSLSSYIRRSASSSASVHSAHSNASSFGNISVEASIQRQPSGGSNRSSAESKRSLKGRSLMYMSSRERLKQKETDRKRVTTHGFDDTVSPASPRKTPHLFPYEDTIREEPPAKDDQHTLFSDLSQFSQWRPGRSESPRRVRINLVDGPSGESLTAQGLIPERSSSLRHSRSPSKKLRKSHHSRNSHRGEITADSVPEGIVKMDPESAIKEQILDELEQEESEVAKRIRELRQQKMLRDKLAGKLPADIDTGARVARLPSPEPSPPLSPSSLEKQREKSTTKAHKLLGIDTGRRSAVSTPSSATRDDARAFDYTATRQPWRHSRPRSMTLNGEDLPPLTPLLPLPINYTLALQSLAESAPSSPTKAMSYVESPRPMSPPTSISIASTKGARTSMRRSNSFAAVGGRPANGRKTSSKFAILPIGHKQSSSITSITESERLAPSRSASEDIAPRPHTLYVGPSSAASISNSIGLQQRRASKKQRWSHPDFPAKAEKAHNDKVNALEAAVTKKIERPIIEERPASVDSVDTDVDSYLNAPRLSQKVRHPQTGRIISFSEVGDPEGYAVFVCVGMGLTRYVMAFYDQLALTLKLRLVTPDRPGCAGSQADPNGTPLSWPDDVLIICQALKITKFSLLAHSAGAVYALATSLRMPQHIRGRVHLLAPWIPPSQMAPIGISQDSPPTQQLPRSQRFLRTLPPSLLKIANSTFLSSTSASLQRTGPKNASRTKRRTMAPQAAAPAPRPSLLNNQRNSMLLMDQVLPNATSLVLATQSPSCATFEEAMKARELLSLAQQERKHAYDERLTFAIWNRATANANPATDLIVCLETKQTIGFRYEDINRPVVIHHGSKDSRVPADNVRWLGKLMRKCEVRILEGEHHGLMASAGVMGNVLTEMATDWEDWSAITGMKSTGDLRGAAARSARRRV